METNEYVGMLHRVIDALTRRLCDDPAGLIHVEPLRRHLRDAMNIAIAVNQDKPGGYSLGELAKILSIRRESVHHRARQGRKLITDLHTRPGPTNLRKPGGTMGGRRG
ncbi:unnamed protein product [[Actinomadura] parvosata subsp. kistnae]|uniref:Uncharacterized protein n=1 Tax=[Actinomadura] parvosata subsp. kistnae TaxID=1909395 RepID=A0A1U9ZY81_9ACTN|nr:hypothetical protein BKM31_16890 [Nonomuraea sp. ATCC 55076]SPL95801.1 unnamed protein product [Actinomadura parvosata subsp. kistnae]